jgi:hypothetical protein
VDHVTVFLGYQSISSRTIYDDDDDASKRRVLVNQTHRPNPVDSNPRPLIPVVLFRLCSSEILNEPKELYCN